MGEIQLRRTKKRVNDGLQFDWRWFWDTYTPIIHIKANCDHELLGPLTLVLIFILSFDPFVVSLLIYFCFILSFSVLRVRFSFLAGCLRYKVDFQSFQLDDEESEFFDLDDY